MVEFIFMLTRYDETVEDCLDCFESLRSLGVQHMGFKDVGVDRDTLHELNRRIRGSGAVSYMEVVSTTSEDCLSSARTAVEIGVDRLLGGTDVEAMLDIIGDSGIGYYPFPGRPEGHPTQLGGSPAEVAADCRRFARLGCAGVDLLAYRATEADPVALMRAAREATDGALIVAGSIDSPDRIGELAQTGVDAFTIGSAIFDGTFSGRKGLLSSQIKDVLAACA